MYTAECQKVQKQKTKLIALAAIFTLCYLKASDAFTLRCFQKVAVENYLTKFSAD